MKRQQIAFSALLRERVDARVLPDIGSIPAKLARLNVVSVRAFAFAKDQH